MLAKTTMVLYQLMLVEYYENSFICINLEYGKLYQANLNIIVLAKPIQWSSYFFPKSKNSFLYRTITINIDIPIHQPMTSISVHVNKLHHILFWMWSSEQEIVKLGTAQLDRENASKHLS